MKAVRIHRFGGPDALSVDELERPQGGTGEALIRVLAASVNPVDSALALAKLYRPIGHADYKIRSGHFPVVMQEDLPIVLGRDIAGIVELCAPGMISKPGEEIYAMLGSDRRGYEEYVVVKPGELARKTSASSRLPQFRSPV